MYLRPQEGIASNYLVTINATLQVVFVHQPRCFFTNFLSTSTHSLAIIKSSRRMLNTAVVDDCWCVTCQTTASISWGLLPLDYLHCQAEGSSSNQIFKKKYVVLFLHMIYVNAFFFFTASSLCAAYKPSTRLSSFVTVLPHTSKGRSTDVHCMPSEWWKCHIHMAKVSLSIECCSP